MSFAILDGEAGGGGGDLVKDHNFTFRDAKSDLNSTDANLIRTKIYLPDLPLCPTLV